MNLTYNQFLFDEIQLSEKEEGDSNVAIGVITTLLHFKLV